MMKILLLAPHPFYQERGTPIAIDLLLESLSRLGHQVDVITFPEGSARHYPGVELHRVSPIGDVGAVRPGFSLKKLYLDLFVFFKFLRFLFTRKYDVVHAVEESVYMAMLICPLKGVPYIYDMDSSMVTQMIDKFGWLKAVEPLLRWIESLPARFAKVVVPCCDALAEDVQPYRNADKPVIPLKDVSLLDRSRSVPEGGLDIPSLLAPHFQNEGLKPKVTMYIGNLESYQGIDLMIEGFALASRKKDELALVIVGGEDADISHYQAKIDQLGLADKCFLAGKQPVGDLYALMLQADIMLSPRTQGINTPMKVYSYLDSGRPVLATRLPTHTQVMSDDIACLVEPDAESFAEGLLTLTASPKESEAMIERASAFIQREHSPEAFHGKVTDIYALFSPAS